MTTWLLPLNILQFTLLVSYTHAQTFSFGAVLGGASPGGSSAPSSVFSFPSERFEEIFKKAQIPISINTTPAPSFTLSRARQTTTPAPSTVRIQNPAFLSNRGSVAPTTPATTPTPVARIRVPASAPASVGPVTRINTRVSSRGRPQIAPVPVVSRTFNKITNSRTND